MIDAVLRASAQIESGGSRVRTTTPAPARTLRVILVVAAVAGVVALGGEAPPAAHAAEPQTACTDDEGVTVVVDFGALGGTKVSCAPWPVRDGLDALDRAGFDRTMIATQPAFVCRIDGKPADDPCQVTPPPDAYWAYFHGARGGGWTYSAIGAGSSHPKPGSVEGWSFGGGDQPGIPPPAKPPTQTPTTPPTHPPTSPNPPATQPTTPTRPTTQQASGAASPAGAPVTTAIESGTGSPTGASSATTSSTATALGPDRDGGSPSAPVGATDESGGSPVGPIVGVVLVAGLGAAATVLAIRRRRTGLS